MIVPTQKGGFAPQGEMPSEANLLMALAEMHRQGRFNQQSQPQPQQQGQPSDVIQMRDGRYKSIGRSGAYEKDMDYKSRIDEK